MWDMSGVPCQEFHLQKERRGNGRPREGARRGENTPRDNSEKEACGDPCRRPLSDAIDLKRKGA